MCWSGSGRPHWLLHFLGAGQTLGDCALRTQRNDAKRDYAGCGHGVNGVHVALMGDPTLRLHPVAPPSALRIARGSAVRLRWRPSPDRAVQGYHVYRASAMDGPFERLTVQPVKAAAFAEITAAGSAACYMVRAIATHRGPGGVYLNASQGVFAGVPARD